MRARTTAAATALALLALVTTAACSGGPKPAAATTPTNTAVVTPSPTTTAPTSSPTSSINAAAVIRAALTKALLTDAEVKLVRKKYKASVSAGVAVPSNIVCGDNRIDPSDQARVDRLQAWWLSKGWTSGTGAQISVSSEVLAYRPGGVAAAVKAYRAAPTTCPTTTFSDKSKGVIKALTTFAGLPKGAVVLSRSITYSTGVKTSGLLIAIPAGNVLGMLYIDGAASDPASIVATRNRLVAVYARQIAAAGKAIGTLTASAPTA